MSRTFGSALKPVVSVLTPSIPERAAMLAECRQSVMAQQYGRWEHLILVDNMKRGCAVTMNRLAATADGEWLLPLADDDLLLPGCLDRMLVKAEQADIVWSRPQADRERFPWFFGEPPRIPSFALIRRTLWQQLGGYDETRNREEDRDLWTRALAQGARFVLTGDEPTWMYRIHGGNKSFNGGVAA